MEEGIQSLPLSPQLVLLSLLFYDCLGYPLQPVQLLGITAVAPRSSMQEVRIEKSIGYLLNRLYNHIAFTEFWD